MRKKRKMPLSKDEVSFELEFDLENVPEEDRETALEDVGQFLVDSILDYVGQGKSPVSGKRDFKALSTPYADREKGGDTLANLDLTGGMLDSLTYKVVGDKVVVGIFDEDEAIKAYNHNIGDTLPKRQFIPDDAKGESLKSDIQRGISSIISEYVDEDN
jgi:hypothetical protein